MMHDGIRLAGIRDSVDLASIKGTALWHFEDMGQTCTLTSCRTHALSSSQNHKCGYLDKAIAERTSALQRSSSSAFECVDKN